MHHSCQPALGALTFAAAAALSLLALRARELPAAYALGASPECDGERDHGCCYQQCEGQMIEQIETSHAATLARELSFAALEKSPCNTRAASQ